MYLCYPYLVCHRHDNNLQVYVVNLENVIAYSILDVMYGWSLACDTMILSHTII